MKNGPYELVKAPAEYPGFKYRGRYVYEHHLVWWQNTGEVVPTDADYLIHHKNHDRRDNAFSNLEKKQRGAHTREHILESRAAKTVVVQCGWCSRDVVKFERVVRRQQKRGQRVFFCCASHGTKYQFNGPR